jgi:hypothetical protein
MKPDLQDAPPDPPPPASLPERLAEGLDPFGQARVPLVLSGDRRDRLGAVLDEGIQLLHARQPSTGFAVFSPVHPDGLLGALAEAIEAIYPTLTLKRLRRMPASGWSSAIQLAGREDPRGRIGRVLAVDPFEDAWDSALPEADRITFLQNLLAIANYPATSVLLVIDSRKLALLRHSCLLQPSLSARFHLRLPARVVRPPVPRLLPGATVEALPLQPIRPRATRPNLRERRVYEAPVAVARPLPVGVHPGPSAA